MTHSAGNKKAADADPLAAGCGRALYHDPVALEPADDPHGYERDTSKLAFVRLRFPVTSEPRPEDLTGALAGLGVREPVSLEILASTDAITYQAVCQRRDLPVLSTRLVGAFAGLALEQVLTMDDPLAAFVDHWFPKPAKQRPAFVFRDYYLPMPYVLPLERVAPSDALLEALARLTTERDAIGGVQLLVVPVVASWLRDASDYLEGNARTVRASHATGNFVEARDPKFAAYAQALRRKGETRFLAVALRAFAFGFGPVPTQALTGLHASISECRRAYDHQPLFSYADRDYEEADLGWRERIHALTARVTYKAGMILSAAEIAALFPFPSVRVLADTSYPLDRTLKTRPAPAHLTRGVRLGTNTHRGMTREVRLPDEDRFKHLYLPGMTGAGKTTFMANLVAHDMAAGHGVAVIDPLGPLLDAVLKLVPPKRINDVVYVDTTDNTHALAFNPIHTRGTDLADRCSDLTTILERVLHFTEQMRMLMRNCLMLLLSVPGATLRDLTRIFRDESFRAYLLERVDDPDTVYFWRDEYADHPEAFRTSVHGISTRLKEITANKTVAAFLCQRQTTVDFAEVIAKKRILLARLVGKPEVKDLLGQVLVSELQLAAWSRPPQTGPHFYLYCDEFQNFLNTGFELILSQGRNQRIVLCVAHQNIGQLGPLIQAIMGNVGATVSLLVGPDEASLFSRAFVHVTPGDFTTLPKYHAWVKVGPDAFSLKLPPPATPPVPETELEAHQQRIVDASRRRYARERALIQYDELPGYDGAARPRARPRGPRDKPRAGQLEIDQSHEDL